MGRRDPTPEQLATVIDIRERLDLLRESCRKFTDDKVIVSAFLSYSLHWARQQGMTGEQLFSAWRMLDSVPTGLKITRQ